jgi:site-specific DNA-methyltransferase (adenine-specific)
MRYHELISVFYKKWGQYYKQMIPRESPRIRQGIKTGWGLDPKPPQALMRGNQNIHVEASKYSPDFKNPSSVLEFNSVKGNSKEKVAHPTQKPVALLEYLVKTYTKENDLVLDFCMGSGSTGVACNNTNRSFIGVELEKDYFDICKSRIYESQSKLI